MTRPAQLARSIRKEVELDAPADVVWQMLTDPVELARWFPLDARVTPGAGGSIFLSWGPQCEGTARIEAWEPGRRLACVEPAPPAPESGGPAPQQVLIEWTLEARGGKTLLSLVQSGFTNDDWQDEYFSSLDYGWGFMFANLKFYLHRHRGVPRQVAWPRRRVAMPREKAWQRLIAADGFPGIAELAAVRPGEKFAVPAPANGQMEGRLLSLAPPRGFCAELTAPHSALLWLSIEGPGPCEVGLWLSAYGVPQAEVAQIERRWMKDLERVFPEGTSAILCG